MSAGPVAQRGTTPQRDQARVVVRHREDRLCRRDVARHEGKRLINGGSESLPDAYDDHKRHRRGPTPQPFLLLLVGDITLSPDAVILERRLLSQIKNTRDAVNHRERLHVAAVSGENHGPWHPIGGRNDDRIDGTGMTADAIAESRG